MTIDKILVIIGSLLGIIFTYWFFLMKKENIVTVSDEVDIDVMGGYSPDVIAIPKGKTTKIFFTRRDPSDCLEEVIIGEFKIRRFLPLNKRVAVEVTPKRLGEFPFACGMNMFHGKIIVR